MDDFLPLNLASRGRFSGYYLKHLHLKIHSHHQEIKEICSAKDSALLKRLKSDKFWNNLNSLVIDKDAFEVCQNLWKKIEPFAHLNTRDLLSLLTDKILPLEQLYLQALQQLHVEKKRRDNNGFWPTHWFSASIEKQISALQENQKRLNSLKTHIQEGLLQRCDIHATLRSSRNVDDVVAALCEKVNGLNILKEPLTTEGTLSATLDDDRRLAIYDYLESTATDKDKLKVLVLSSIPKRQHISFKSKNEIKANLRGMRKFRNNVLDKLSFEESQGNKLTSRLVPSAIRKAGKETVSAIQSTLQNIGLYSPLSHLWHLRFFLYLGLSYLSYHYLVMTLLPIAPFFLSVATTAMLSSVLFYTVALAPVWWLSWVCLKSLKEGIREYLLHWKKSEVCDSLYALTQSQEFIANHLSQKIVDLPHFDIGKLADDVCHHRNLLEESLKKLQHYSFGERRLCRGNTQQAVDEAIERIKSQQKYIEAQLQDLACHIALRIGQEIDLLERTSSKLKFEPILPPEQVQSLKTFIWTYGDETALHQFKLNVNPINKWVNKINRFYTPQDETEAPSLNQPWGGNSIRKDTLNGWNILLNAFILNPKQKQAALRLNEVLAGKAYPNPQQFHEMIRNLEAGEQVARVLQNIQGYLFATLNSKSLQNARLLSSHHKSLIAQWYHQNEGSIKQAEIDISIFFEKFKRNTQDIDKFDDDYLNNIFELLEGAEIYHHSKGLINTSNKRYQSIRKYFEEYSGETSRVIRLLRFVPSPDVNKLHIDVAKKRLGWILQQIKRDSKHSKHLTDSDIELFQDCTLISSKDKFNFSEFISLSTQFNQPWDPKMERFLRECQRNGLDSGKLLKNYQANNQRIKPFLLSKIDKATCAEAKIASNSSEVIRRRTHRVSH